MTERDAGPTRRPIHPAIARHAPAMILIAIGLLLYGYTLPFPFVFDDHIYLVENPLAIDGRSFRFPFEFRDFANRAVSLGLQTDLSTNFILRPLAYLTFYLNYLVGGLNPPGFRAVNILIHCANAVLLFELLTRLLRYTQPVPVAEKSARFVATTAALLFLVHPLNIESVTYIIQRFTSLGTTFYLATVLLFLAARTATDASVARRCRRWSLASLLAGMLTKEFLFTAPFMMAALDWIVLRTPLREVCRRILPWAALLPIIPVLMGLTAAAQSGSANFSAWLNIAAQDQQDTDFSRYYALTQPGVILRYLRLIFIPLGLNIDPEFPLVKSPGDWRFWGPLTFHLALLVGAWRWHRLRTDDPLRVLTFAFVGWYFLTLSIDSSIVPLPDVMSEHRSYLPSIGIIAACACLAEVGRQRLLPYAEWRWLVPAGLGVCVVALMMRTIERHEKWRSNLALWSDAAAKSPNKVRVWANLGTALGNEGLNSRAAEIYARAIALDPKNANAHFNFAKVEMRLGHFREAVALAQAGLRIDPKASVLHQISAEAFMRLHEYENALRSVERSSAMRPGDPWDHLTAAEAFARLGRFAEARQHCNIARSIGVQSDAEREWHRTIEALMPAGTASR